MPAKIARTALCWALLPAMSSAQVTFKRLGPYMSAQNALPSEGPVAARFNPARLAEVRLASVAYGRYSAASGKGATQFVETAMGTPWDILRWPVGLAAGVGYMNNESVIDGTNAVYEQAEFDPGFAVSFPADPESPYRLEAGTTYAIGEYNAFDVVRSFTFGTDVGMLASIRGGAGRFSLGFAYHGYKPHHVRLPDNSGSYRIPGWMEPSFEWISRTGEVHTHLSYFINEPPDPGEGPSSGPRVGVSGWDIEYRPVPWLGLKAERPTVGSRSMVGAVWRPILPMEHAHAFLEIAWGHERFGPARIIPSPIGRILFGDHREDEGLGYLLAASLGAEI